MTAIITIALTDTLISSRDTINTNFSNLNNSKAETSDLSLKADLSIVDLKINKSGDTLTGLIQGAKSTDIVSATTTNLATLTGNYVHITGTTTITSFGTVTAGTKITTVFDGILTLTYNATSLKLPGSANITTAVGDSAIFESEGSGNWKCVSYQKVNGKALVESSIYRIEFGDGSDGDIVISTTTTLTRDMYYNNLTLNDAVELKPNGFRIFVKGTLTRLGTGKISAYGGNGGNGGNGVSSTGSGSPIGGTAGTAGTIANSEGTLPSSFAGVIGGNGGDGDSRSRTGTTGLSSTYSIINTGVSGGNGGNAGQASGIGLAGIAGIAGTNSGTNINPLYTYNDKYSLISIKSAAISYINISVGNGSGGGGGFGNAGGTSYAGGGGGGGSGASGGIIWISINSIIANNTNILFDTNGGTGGNGGNGGNNINGYGAGGGGGGAGGNGGYISIVYSSTTHTLSAISSILGGTRGTFGTGGTGGFGNGANGSSGNSGNVGLLKTLNLT